MPDRPSEPSHRPAERAPLGLPELLWIVATATALVVLYLEPLLSYAVFGSDTGEYFALTQSIAVTGHLPTPYGGWGTAYPDFPGTFVLSAVVGGTTGADAFYSLVLVVPALAALSFLPLYLLFRRIFPNDRIAIVGAALASVMIPRAFSIAHPAPLALGDFLGIAALWMFVEGRRDLRWYLPLSLTSGALIVTHHLSSFFFLVVALGSLLLLELWKPGAWSRRFPRRELLFVGGFLVVMLGDWFVYARAFLPVVSEGSIGSGGWALVPFEAAAVAIVGGCGLALRWRRSRPTRPIRVRMPSDASLVRDLALLLAGTFVGVGIVVVVNLPGSSQHTSPSAVLFFAPMLVVIALASGTRRLLTSARLGPLALTWLAAIGLSAFIALATSNPVLSPERHAEYLVIPLGLLVAVGTGRLVARAGDRAGRPAVLAGSVAIVVLLAANAAIVYPPPADLGGFQEGLTVGDATLWGWYGIATTENTTVATDHRLSSMIFGFDGRWATWDSTPALFNGANRTEAWTELAGSFAPHTQRPVDAVAIDATMRSGVALDPSRLAEPLSPSAVAWFAAPPFVPVYENGAEMVYWIAGPVGA